MITQTRLKELFNYEPLTGVLTNRTVRSKRIKKGYIAGFFSKGYWMIGVDGISHPAHRLVWVYVHGNLPAGMYIDHINGYSWDNRVFNLRLATNAENLRNRGKQTNNTSGFKGVTWYRPSGKWKSQCKVNSKNFHLGYFDTKEEASAAYESFASKAFGEFYSPS